MRFTWMRCLLAVAVLALSPAGMMPAHAQDAAGVSAPDKVLKHKIAVGRFTNETRYGKSLLRDADLDPLGKQASDIMAAYLTMTDRFLVFERSDLSKIEREQALQGAKSDGPPVIGVDTLILGSIVEFGVAEDGKRGLFNRKKVETAHAKVAIRLVDVRTGLVFHSATGEGEATTETKTVLGIGSTSRFDGTLTDKAISVAIEDVIEELVNTLADRPWRTDILQVAGDNIFIAGGAHQGVSVGDQLVVMRRGETVKSQQTGFDITLPATRVAMIEVTSLFGESETNEGAVARLVSGTVKPDELPNLYVSASGK